MKLNNITKILTIGTIALIMVGCGGGSSSGGSSTPPVQPSPSPTEPPLSNNGNQILLPGYIYANDDSKSFEMYILEPGGRVIFGGKGCSYLVYDANYNEYTIDQGNRYKNKIHLGNAYDFAQGQYFIATSGCAPAINPKTLTVQSNVLYNPLAQ